MWLELTDQGTDPPRQHQSPPQIAEVVGDQTEPQLYLIGSDCGGTQPRHLHRLLTPSSIHCSAVPRL